MVELVCEEANLWFKLSENSSSTTVRRQVASHDREKKRKKHGFGVVKCNVYSSWINSSSMCGGGWIARDHHGNALFHGRDAFVAATNQNFVELRVIIWEIKSLKDLHVERFEVWSDCMAAIQAIPSP